MRRDIRRRNDVVFRRIAMLRSLERDIRFRSGGVVLEGGGGGNREGGMVLEGGNRGGGCGTKGGGIIEEMVWY